MKAKRKTVRMLLPKVLPEALMWAHFRVAVGKVQDYIHQNNVAKGFWPEDKKSRNDGEAMMLMVTEIAEAMEAHRHGNPPDDKVPEFSGVEAELADAVIRILDFAKGKNLRVVEAICAKVEYNKSRPYKHGKTC